MKRRHVFAALGALALPARAALDTAALERVAAEIDLHSLLVWQRGTLLMEHYRSSRDKPIGSWFAREVQFGPDVLHDMRSISKSVVGLLVGQAIARGELALAQPVLELFPELADLRAGPQAAITVEHLLTMSSGLAWAEEVSTYGSNANDEQRLFFDAAPARYILDRPLVAAPGALWHYNGGLTALLAEAGHAPGPRAGQLRGLGQRRPAACHRARPRTGRGVHGRPIQLGGHRRRAGAPAAPDRRVLVNTLAGDHR